MMYNLNFFTAFDSRAFFSQKILRVLSVEEWTDFDTKAHLGRKYECVILRDDTSYGVDKEGKKRKTNLYEKIMVKAPDSVVLQENQFFKILAADCTIYGDYRNQLSVKATEVQPLKDQS